MKYMLIMFTCSLIVYMYSIYDSRRKKKLYLPIKSTTIHDKQRDYILFELWKIKQNQVGYYPNSLDIDYIIEKIKNRNLTENDIEGLNRLLKDFSRKYIFLGSLPLKIRIK